MRNLKRYYDIFQKMPTPLRQGSSHFAAKGGILVHTTKIGTTGYFGWFLGFF